MIVLQFPYDRKYIFKKLKKERKTVSASESWFCLINVTRSSRSCGHRKTSVGSIFPLFNRSQFLK